MANLTLQATSPLNEYHQQFGDTTLSEVVELSIYSIGLAIQPDAALTSINNELGIPWPDTGRYTVNDSAKYRLLGLQADQAFLLVAADASEDARPNLDASAYITDQSDSWAALRLSGPMSRRALERICPVDLHPSVFKQDCVTRTSMEHLAVIILCEADDQYLLLSPTSSAESFLHAVETSIKNVY